MLDVVGEKAAEPEGVVSQMRAHEKHAPGIRTFRVFEKRGEGIILFIVRRAHSSRAIAHAKVHEDGSDVVGECTIVFAHAPKGVPHDYVAEQWQRCARAKGLLHNCPKEPWIIENSIDPLFA